MKVSEAKKILAAIGLPQQNTRTALVLLSMFDLPPTAPWPEASVNTLGTTQCMNWMADNYPDIPKGKKDPVRYAPNSRESVRKESIQPLVHAGVLLENGDVPGRATNDQNYCYHPSELALKLVRSFGTPDWEKALAAFYGEYGSLRERWAAERKALMVPVKLPDGTLRLLSSGRHSELIKGIVEIFAAQFTPGGVVVYLGDTGEKWIVNRRDYLAELGVSVDPHGKMPDVVIHHVAKDWLVLVEAVASKGVVSGKRVDELKRLFKGARPGLVFVTAFLTKEKFRENMADIAWETDVWIAEHGTHLVHFNGERFLGPYE